MERRNFIKLGATAGAMALMPFEIKAMLKAAEEVAGCDFSKRRLILINLAGGNDGLNTIIPINQYDIYSALRPTIKVPDTGVSGYIPLDSTLQNDQQVGLNPSMVEFKSLYDKGNLRLIQSVGYPSQNKSHFASTDLYMTGNDGNGLQNGSQSGWIGRFMEKHYGGQLSENYPLAIQIGSLQTSLGFHGEEEHGMSMNLTNQDPAGFYSIINGLGGEPPVNIPSTDFGEELKYIVETDKLANVYAETVSSSFNAGTNINTYPDTDIADQLKTVAKLISGGLDTKIYMVRLSGFDTHNLQVETAGDAGGKHNRLLGELSDAVGAFCADLESIGIADDVVGLTYSEFGRKAKENGNLGTDHGEIAPMFVFGKGVEGGVSGTNPDLTEAEDSNNHQIRTVQFDYRSIFGTLLQQYMGAGNEIIDDTFFNHTTTSSFSDAHVANLLQTDKVIQEDCRTNSAISIESSVDDKVWSVSPNPCTGPVIIRCTEDYDMALVELITSSGRTIVSESRSSVNGMLQFDFSNLSQGVYTMVIRSKGLETSFLKLIKS